MHSCACARVCVCVCACVCVFSLIWHKLKDSKGNQAWQPWGEEGDERGTRSSFSSQFPHSARRCKNLVIIPSRTWADRATEEMKAIYKQTGKCSRCQTGPQRKHGERLPHRQCPTGRSRAGETATPSQPQSFPVSLQRPVEPIASS